MPFSVSLYNDCIFKSVVPQADIYIPNELRYVPNKEYILWGYRNKTFNVQQLYEIKKITFTVKNIIFRNYKNDYAIITGIINSYQDGNEIPLDENPMIKGCFYNIYKDSVYECEGFWEYDKDNRLSFRVMAYSQVKNSSIAVVQEYLRNVFKGLSVGPVTIKKITDLYGLSSIEKIKENDKSFEKLIKNKGKRNAMITRLIDQEEREKALEYLVQWGISVSSIISIIDSLGASAFNIIKKNPNVLFKFPFVSSKIIDKIAMNEGFKYNDKERIIGFIKRYFYDKEVQNGDIYINYDDFCPEEDDFFDDSLFSSYVIKNGLYKEKLMSMNIKMALNELINLNFIVRETDILDSSKEYLYRQYYNFAENQIVEKLKYLKSKYCPSFITDNDINMYISNEELKGFVMDIKQKDAVKMALQNSISILSGGPGTGKTQTIKMIVDIFLNEFPDKHIQLCAPTGKASRRMSEVISLPATTIHKSLNYVPFSEIELNDIKADLLIIDETSMMDVDLFFKVLSHISENTSILLVGDYNQLPSVGPGLILRDLIDSKIIPTTILTKVFRQTNGSNIVETAYYVLNNNPKAIRPAEKGCHDDFMFFKTKDSSNISSIISRYFETMSSRGISYDSIQVITPFNNGYLGVSGLNMLIRDIVNPNGRALGEIYISPTKTFWCGDRVIQTKNNYDLEVFNGSIGKIISIDSSKNSAIIEFDGVKKDYKHKDILDLKLGYAITVHKSQGSEFEYVIMPMSMEHLYVSNRNLLYTAITRAKKKFILVGTEESLIKTCDKIEHFSRKSQIKNKLIY